jgi:hypothetical protein
MKNNFIIFVVVNILCYACSTNNHITFPISGTFVWIDKEYPNYKTELTLISDSTFQLIFKGGIEQYCEGKWIQDSNYIVLYCAFPEEWTETIARGYLSKRTYKIKLISSNKLKFPVENNVRMKYKILKRKQ